MKKLARLIVILFTLLCSFNLFAVAAYFGGVAYDCGQLVTSHDRNETIVIDTYKHSILGFISGINIVQDTRVGENVSADAIYIEVLNYCRENPLDLVGRAALETYFKILHLYK